MNSVSFPGRPPGGPQEGVQRRTRDLVARTAAAPRQLPVGAIMALLGVPVFLVLLRRLEGPRV